MPSIFDLVELFYSVGYTIIVVTNQSGIGRGYYTKEDFEILSKWMIERFAQKEIVITDIFHCPHAPEEKCNCRKPKTGMIEKALGIYDIDLDSSYMIGDKQSDIDLSKNASIGFSISIGDNIDGASYSFQTITQAYKYLKENRGIL